VDTCLDAGSFQAGCEKVCQRKVGVFNWAMIIVLAKLSIVE